ncbi:MAG: 50S ribosomal protein L9 [Alphaproteobacteria bacterium]|nr:50S ribosomal protein L9 [Alphaproteobacteria bacterium]
MQVILLERVEKLGQMGQVVTVKPGFARNFLLPKKKAIRATKSNLTYFDTQKVELEAQNLKRKEEATHVGSKMENVMVTVLRQASEVGHLFGSVRGRDISEGLSQAGYNVSKLQIELISPIKTLGIHTARVVLHPEVSIDVLVNVAQSEEEAVVQREAAAQKTAAK